MTLAANIDLYVIYPILTVLSFVILYRMAKSRGRRPILWGIFGAITLVVALIAILIAGRSDDAPLRSPS